MRHASEAAAAARHEAHACTRNFRLAVVTTRFHASTSPLLPPPFELESTLIIVPRHDFFFIFVAFLFEIARENKSSRIWKNF